MPDYRCVFARAHTRTHNTHKHTHAHTHAHTHTQTHTHTHTHANTHTHAHTHAHTLQGPRRDNTPPPLIILNKRVALVRPSFYLIL